VKWSLFWLRHHLNSRTVRPFRVLSLPSLLCARAHEKPDAQVIHRCFATAHGMPDDLEGVSGRPSRDSRTRSAHLTDRNLYNLLFYIMFLISEILKL
jgi:hypothetical protein